MHLWFDDTSVYWKSFLGNLIRQLIIRYSRALKLYFSSAICNEQKKIMTKQLLFQTKVQKSSLSNFSKVLYDTLF